jgi:Contractile injection system tube protein
MTTFPNSPRLVKGRIVALDPFNPKTTIVEFQYNPDAMTRRLQVQSASGEGAQSEALRLKGAAVESFTLEAEIDATDKLEKGEGNAVSVGIQPQLAALEVLAYPKSTLVSANAALLASGTIEVIPPTGPLTLLVWGRRVLPVRLTEFNITEEAFDEKLNPIRARVSLGLQALSYNDLPVGSPGYSLFLSYQQMKENMATMGGASRSGSGVSIGALTGS